MINQRSPTIIARILVFECSNDLRSFGAQRNLRENDGNVVE
jgi:hypothetical protein